MRKTAYLLIALILLALCAPAALAEEKATKDLFAMDTHISITAYGEMASEALEAAEALLLERERLWSVTLEGSDIHAGQSRGQRSGGRFRGNGGRAFPRPQNGGEHRRRL